MKMTWMRGTAALWNADGVGGGGGAPPASAPAAAAAAAPVVPPSGAPAATPPVAGAPVTQQAAADYWPDGLDPSFKGADAKGTLDNMAKLAKDLKGYRDRDATRGVPEKPEDYTDFSKLGDKFKLDPKNAPHFEALKTDPVFGTIAAAAHKHGVGQLALAEIYQSALNSMSEAGLLEPPIDVAAERAALVPDAAKSLPPVEQAVAVQKRLDDNYAFLDLMVENRGMPKEIAQHLELSLGDSAKGHAAIEWFKAQLQQGGAQAGAHGQGGGAVTAESLQAEMAALEKNKNAPDYRERHAALQEKYRQFHGG
jgi:hypothetical protein